MGCHAMMPKHPPRAFRSSVAALFLILSGAAFAQTTTDYAVVDGVTVYLAVLPAEMLRTFPPGSEESRMHGGVPGGKHFHHVQVALFDANSGARITDATVSATVAEIGLAGVRQNLEPFTVGEALTYGGYFEFQKREIYEIAIRATLPEGSRTIETTFEYEHM